MEPMEGRRVSRRHVRFGGDQERVVPGESTRVIGRGAGGNIDRVAAGEAVSDRLSVAFSVFFSICLFIRF